jgi:GAF domain-containing protein
MDSGERPSNVDGDSLSDLYRDVSQTAGTLFSAGSVNDTLASVLELALTTIEGCDFAGLFTKNREALTTPVSSDPTVLEVDAVQRSTGEGPCLDAIAHRLIVYADDLETDLRWSHFSPQAAGVGIRSVLSIPLAPDSQEAALNLYASYPAAFGIGDRARATILASLASLALSIAHSHEDEERRAENLIAALGTRETIGEALGILMERERITANQAFDILRRASQHLNIKLRDVAQNLVDTGESPDTGPSQSL